VGGSLLVIGELCLVSSGIISCYIICGKLRNIEKNIRNIRNRGNLDDWGNKRNEI
jgi:hypothetical protein